MTSVYIGENRDPVSVDLSEYTGPFISISYCHEPHEVVERIGDAAIYRQGDMTYVTWPRDLGEPCAFPSVERAREFAVAVAVDAGTTAAAVERARQLAREASDGAARAADAVAGRAAAEREVAR